MSAIYKLNTTDSSVNIHINSADCDIVVGKGKDSNIPSTSDFIIVLEDTIMCDEDVHMLVSVENCSIPYTFYNVSAALYNNTFIFQEGSNTPVTITIPSQNYDVDDMISVLPPLLNNASVIGASYTMTFDDKSLKLTFTSNSTTVFSMDFSSTSDNNVNKCGALLGFFKKSYSSPGGATNTITGHSVNFNTVPFILLDTEFGARGSIVTSPLDDQNTFTSGVLAKIQVDENFGDMINYVPQGNRHTLILGRKRLHDLRITARDPQFNPIDLNGAFMSVTLNIDFINFDITQGIEEDSRVKNHLSTREDINEMLQKTLMEQGATLAKEASDRNKLINILGLDASH